MVRNHMADGFWPSAIFLTEPGNDDMSLLYAMWERLSSRDQIRKCMAHRGCPPLKCSGMQAKAKAAPKIDKFPHGVAFLGFARYRFVVVGATNHVSFFPYRALKNFLIVLIPLQPKPVEVSNDVTRSILDCFLPASFHRQLFSRAISPAHARPQSAPDSRGRTDCLSPGLAPGKQPPALRHQWDFSPGQRWA